MINGEDNHRQSMNRKAVRNPLLVAFFILFFFYGSGAVDAQVSGQSGYSLIGTIQSGDFRGAVIGISKGEQTFFRLGEKLPDGSQIVKVMPDSITLKSADGTRYDIYLSHERIAAPAEAPSSVADSASGSVRRLGPTPEQQERIFRMRQQAIERAQRRKKEDE